VTSSSSPELSGLATALGVQTSYWDTRGQLHEASPDALVAVLGSMGAPVERPDDLDELHHHVERHAVRLLDPVVVWWTDQARACVEVRLPLDAELGTARASIALEAGGEVDGEVDLHGAEETGRRHAGGQAYSVRRVVLPFRDELPVGYHRLVLEVGAARHQATLVVAPRRVERPAWDERTWGVVAPLYALRPAMAMGPHVGELAEIGRWIDAEGGRLVGTLPMLATYLDEPCDPSPYTPVSQRFWNELYLDLAAAPELAASPEARARLTDPATQRGIAELGAADRFDHRAQYRLLRPVLEDLAASFFAAPASTRAEFDRWLAAEPTVGAYAAFRAATDRTGTGWHAWGTGAGRLPAGTDADGPEARLHQYVQWTMRRQLADVAAELAGREQRLYLDLPVGTHGDGFDTWSNHELFAWGCGVGAPPDDFFSEGQNWGFPPVSPVAARDQGHRHLAACLRHHMSAAGMLRLDHVMGFHRLYWVPDGADARDGVYVHYPREELFAVLAVESHRSGCRVLGEDLGTVPDEVRDAVDEHGLLGMYVSQFQLPRDGDPIPEPTDRQVASIDTHDTPTFAGWMAGLDIEIRRGMGLLDERETGAAYGERQRHVDHLMGALQRAGLLGDPAGPHDTLVALLAFLGSSPAASVLVGVDDLVGETEPQNVPGTALDRPNWVRKLPGPIRELDADPRVRRALETLQSARLSAHHRAQEESS
jgi:4-alpha-glucanotransferase